MATMIFSMILLGAMAPLSTAPAPVQRLTDAQVEQVLAAAAKKREAAEAAAPTPKIEIHGEVGVAVGTGGYNAIYGTAFVPLGDDSAAILSLSSETSPYYRRGHRERR